MGLFCTFVPTQMTNRSEEQCDKNGLFTRKGPSSFPDDFLEENRTKSTYDSTGTLFPFLIEVTLVFLHAMFKKWGGFSRIIGLLVFSQLCANTRG